MDLDLGPLSVLICWQSLVLALSVSTGTHGVKSALDFSITGGKEARKKKVFIHRIVLPATPILLGILVAVFVPLHPEALLKYFTEHSLSGVKKFAILCAYGAFLGQFSDFVWHRFSSLTEAVKKKGAEKPVEKAAEPAPPTDPDPTPPV
jgi:hypothetical protein